MIQLEYIFVLIMGLGLEMVQTYVFFSDYTKENNCHSNFGDNYCFQDSLAKDKSIFTGNLDNNNQYYKINEIEAFKLYK